MKKHGPILAFDRQSVRTVDANGHLHVALTHISKANVCEYMGAEIPQFVALGLDPGRVYKLWRDPDELAKGADTFNRQKIMIVHKQVSAENPIKESTVGTIGSDAVFNAPYLDASICIWDGEAIAMIESGALEELSCAYRYDADMTPGTTPDGEAYDGRMTNIRGNHLALVEVGRAGPDVVVADHNPFTPKQEIPAMKYTKLGLALKVALSAASPKIAQDSGLPALVGKATAKAFKKDEVRAKLIAMDGDMDNQQLDDIIDAILGVEQNPEPETPPTAVGDENDGGASSKHAEIIDFLKGKGLDASDLEAVGAMLTRMDKPEGADELPDDVMKKDDVTAAMDSMRSDLTKQFQDLEVAKSAVRATVGDVIGMDSAESVYRFALDHMKVAHKDTPAAGLRNLFDVASSVSAPKTPVIASDSAVSASIPGLDRFSR